MSLGFASSPLRVVLCKSLGAVAVAALLVGTSACSKEKPKSEESTKSDPTPIPSGLVFNDFVPTTGSGEGLGVRGDAGAGALGGVAGEGDPREGEAPAESLKVTDPGAEPRSVRKYTFASNRVDKRVLTITQSVAQNVDGHTAPGQDITIKLFLDLSVKQVKPAGATLEAKITKVELPGAPPQAAQVLASMNGLTGTFDVTPNGDVGEVAFVANQQMRNQLAETVVQGVSQAVQLLVAPFPRAPIGVGAKWEMGGASSEGAGDLERSTKRFVLKEVGAEGGVVDADIEIKVPRRVAQGPGGVPMSVAVDGKGHYTYQVRFDRTSSKVEGELSLSENIEVVDPKRGGKQSVSRVQKAKHLIEGGK